MNILILSWRDPKHPLAGGAEQVTHQHAKAWLAAGHNVYLFSSKFKGARRQETIDGVSIIRCGHEYLGVQIAACIYYLKNSSKFDIIFDQFHGLPFFTPLYARIPKIASIHETANQVWFLNHLPKPFNLIVGIIGYLIEPLIFLFYKNIKFIAVSRSTKLQIQALGIPKNHIQLIPAAVIVDGPKQTIAKTSIPTLTYLGVLSKDKGIEDALKCFSLLSLMGHFNFWVIGKKHSKQYGRYLKKLVQKLGIAKKIKFWGFVSEKNKFKLLAKSHLLINPSVREGWGLVNIEANSQGTPVVAYSSPGLVDSIKDGVSGVLLKKNTPVELAITANNLLDDQKRYQKLQKGAYFWSKQFVWEKSQKMSLELIEKIAKPQKQR